MYLWGANSNTVVLLLPAPADEHLHGLSPEAYIKRVNNLDSAGFAGLDPDMANHTIEQYIMKYSFKGETNSAASDAIRRSITQAFCNQHTDSDKRVGNLIAKHMYEVTNSQSQTNQEVSFQEGGGYTL